MSASTMYEEVTYQSDDGLTLYARDYPKHPPAQTLLCMHGLTRNSSDFEPLCDYLHQEYRIVSVDQRGRGRSQYDPNIDNYQPARYVQDMFTLIEHLGLDKPVLVGTSMGGLMAMIMQATQVDGFAGLILNDIGPEVNPAGLARIASYVGKSEPVSNWDEAVSQVKLTNQAAFPAYSDDQWRAFAARLYRENDQGVPVLQYDSSIAKPMDDGNTEAVAPDLWPVFEACRSLPVLVIRGELSDILHPDCVSRMHDRHPGMQSVEVPGVGHAPMLDEPLAVDAIQRFLQEL